MNGVRGWAKLAEDRRVLENIIFAHYRDDADIRTVLFVGCESYTAHYQRTHFAAHEFWTLDPNEAHRRFGARRHVVARLEELGLQFPPGTFNLIICNGVYGWGLDRLADCEAAIQQCHLCLAEGGHLLLGWNDLAKWDPAPLAKVSALARFSEYTFPPLGTWQYLTDTSYRHTYSFYRKSAS
jgi:SAM-dependent methyltransferase